MRRRRNHRQQTPVSLFPFLAVLICTMGSLIVLLVIVVQQARVEAKTVSGTHESAVETTTESEDVEWKREILEAAHQEKTEELSEQRLRLAGIEDHIRRLEDQLRKMSEDAQALQNPAHLHQQDRAAVKQELERLSNDIVKARDHLNQLKEEAKNRPQSFSIVPYEGPNGTMRRPIFIECRADQIILQPEGTVLLQSDFHGPLGPSNALASALRATREFWATQDTTGSLGEPYPLLIVRPDGSNAYAAARRAMKSWEAEFGYELVDNEMNLQFPKADPALTALLERTLDEARQRRYFLAKAAPSQYGNLGSAGYVASSQRGGFVREGGFRDDGRGGWGGKGRTEDTGHALNGRDHEPGKSSRQAGDTSGKFAENESVQDPSTATDEMTEEFSAQGASSNQGESQNTSGATGNSPIGSVTPVADTRGANWGVRKPQPNAIGFTRPIRVACFADRIVVLPDRDQAIAPQTVPMEQSTRNAIDSVVSAIWNHVDRWGIAGKGSYWKPVLRMEVSPDGESRFTELKTLLRASGIEIQRTSP